MPRRNVRRGSAILVTNMALLASSNAIANLKVRPPWRLPDARRRGASETARFVRCRRRSPRTGSCRAPRRRSICPHRRRIVVLDAAAQRVRQQLFGERAGEDFRPREQRMPQPGHAVEGLGRRAAARHVERRTVVGARAASGRPRRSSPARARSDRCCRWHAAQTALLRCSAISSRIVCARAPASFSLSGGTLAAAAAAARRAMFSRIHLPRRTGEVRWRARSPSGCCPARADRGAGCPAGSETRRKRSPYTYGMS